MEKKKITTDEKLQDILDNIDSFFGNEENIKQIEKNKKYSEKISEFIEKNSDVPPEILNQPFC